MLSHTLSKFSLSLRNYRHFCLHVFLLIPCHRRYASSCHSLLPGSLQKPPKWSSQRHSTPTPVYFLLFSQGDLLKMCILSPLCFKKIQWKLLIALRKNRKILIAICKAYCGPAHPYFSSSIYRIPYLFSELPRQWSFSPSETLSSFLSWVTCIYHL